jgi:predicted small lipoprotein YifL
MKTLSRMPLGLAALALLSLAACGKKDQPAPADTPVAMAPAPAPAASISTIETGKHIGPNKRVTEVTSEFGTKDTLYLAVVTENSTPTTMLTAKWTFQTGQLVDSTAQAVARTDSTNTAAVTEFHLVKPTGWPVGTYTVELWLDGVSAGKRDIEVKK